MSAAVWTDCSAPPQINTVGAVEASLVMFT